MIEMTIDIWCFLFQVFDPAAYILFFYCNFIWYGLCVTYM